MIPQRITIMGKPATEQHIDIMTIRVHAETYQPRTGYRQDLIARLTDAYRVDSYVLPVVVMRLESGELVLLDGHHRVTAAMNAGKLQILAQVIHGTKRDAIIFAAGLNAHHGSEMTRDDRKKAARMLFDTHGVRGSWSAGMVGKHIGVSATTALAWFLEFSGGEKTLAMTKRGSASSKAKNSRKGKQVPDATCIRSCSANGGSSRSYYVCWRGGHYYLAANQEQAEAKLKDLVESGCFDPDSQNQAIKLDRPDNVKKWLARRGVIVEGRPPGHINTMTRFCLFSMGASPIGLADCITARAIPHFVGEALMDRVATGAARAVVLCYLPDDCRELADRARKLGVEFLSPDEFVESVNGAPVEAES